MSITLVGLLFFSLAYSIVSAQTDKVVEWSASYDEAKNSVIIDADMKDDWVIYSQHTDPEGPIPLEFEFGMSEKIVLDGEVLELDKPITIMSDMFGVEVMKFKDKASFEQKLGAKPTKGNLSINVTYMTCDSKRCLPPTTVPLYVKFGS